MKVSGYAACILLCIHIFSSCLAYRVQFNSFIGQQYSFKKWQVQFHIVFLDGAAWGSANLVYHIAGRKKIPCFLKTLYQVIFIAIKYFS